MWLRKYRIVGIAVMCIVVATQTGCASNKSVANSWIGNHVDDLTAEWGAPDSRIAREDGGFTYTYSQHMTNLGGMEWRCRWTFVTDASNHITKVNSPSEWNC